MKRSIAWILCLGVATAMLLAGCKKNSDNPVAPSFVDAYSVNLTEDEGTVHSGDFFPIAEGYTCNYQGSEDIGTVITLSGQNPLTDNASGPTIGMMSVLAPRMISLPSGALNLYPVVDLIQEPSAGITTDTSRFFMKDTVAVYVKALRLTDGSYLEVDHPLFVKSRLVAGDTWESAPQMDMARMFENAFAGEGTTADLSVDARSKFFVVGSEAVSLPIGTRISVRLEQASELNMTGTVWIESTPCAMVMHAELKTVLHMIADTGVVQQNTTGTIGMTLSAQGETITVSITIRKSELNLVSVSTTPPPVQPKRLDASLGRLPSLHSSREAQYLRLARMLTRIVTGKPGL